MDLRGTSRESPHSFNGLRRPRVKAQWQPLRVVTCRRLCLAFSVFLHPLSESTSPEEVLTPHIPTPPCTLFPLSSTQIHSVQGQISSVPPLRKIQTCVSHDLSSLSHWRNSGHPFWSRPRASVWWTGLSFWRQWSSAGRSWELSGHRGEVNSYAQESLPSVGDTKDYSGGLLSCSHVHVKSPSPASGLALSSNIGNRPRGVGNVAQLPLRKANGEWVGTQDPRPQTDFPVGNQACIVPRPLWGCLSLKLPLPGLRQ